MANALISFSQNLMEEGKQKLKELNPDMSELELDFWNYFHAWMCLGKGSLGE